MFVNTHNHPTNCNCLQKLLELVKLSAYGLLLSLFFTPVSFAQNTTPDINAEYLNNLTQDKVSWSEASEEEISAGKDIALINGVHYKYAYIMPSDYKPTNVRLNNNLTATNTQSVVFNGSSLLNYNGGAIYNSKDFKNPINADFIGNHIKSSTGGAIYNGAQYTNSTVTIGDITGDFIGNYIQSQLSASNLGGAIHNGAHYTNSTITIGDITGDFIGNYIQSQSYLGEGGAIYNYANLNSTATIGNITGDFIGNYIQSQSHGKGGVILNSSYASIGDITGNFISNYIKSQSSYGYGGAIYNNAYNSNATATIGNITGDFIDNYIQSQSDGKGGAIYNNSTASNSAITIGDITGNFIGNHIKSQSSYGQGGAIYNYADLSSTATIGDITGDFIGNYIQAQTDGKGGAIYNYAVSSSTATIGNITGDFIGNYIQSQSDGKGGAIYNNSTLSLINANFLNNYVQTNSTNEEYTQGGAIYNDGGTLNITANAGKQSVFTGNQLIYKDSSGNDIKESNAIHQTVDGILNLSAFEGAQIIFDDKLSGEGKIYITGDQNSQITFNESVESGLIDISDTKVLVNGDDFINSLVHDDGILNVGSRGVTQNTTVGNNGKLIVQSGGVTKNTIVDNNGKLIVQSGGVTQNTTVDNNGKLIVQKDGVARDSVVFLGGSIEAQTNTHLHNLIAQERSILNLDANSLLTGHINIDVGAVLQGSFNYNKLFEKILNQGATLTLTGGVNNKFNQTALINSSKNKQLVLSDGSFNLGNGAYVLSGWKTLSATDGSTLKLVGDTNNKSQISADTINMLTGSTLALAGNSPLNATINGNINNAGLMNFTHSTDGADDITTVKGNYHAYKNASMIIDVDPSSNTADLLVIEGDVVGRTKVVIRPIGNGMLSRKALFVSAPNDDVSTGAYFDVFRMDGDAREWNSLYENNKWFVATSNVIPNSSSGYGSTDDDEELQEDDYNHEYENIVITPPNDNSNNNNNNDDDNSNNKVKLVSEALAYMALPQIGLEQTRDLIHIVSNKVASTKNIAGRCGMSECGYDNNALKGAWINLGQTKSTIDAPISAEAKIKSVDLGFDIQHNLNNRLGIFGSYRQGNYEISGDGDNYYSSVNSEYDINSWILGLYHRYDKDLIWTMSTIYGGIQQVDLTTDDNVSSDTKGIQLGASIEAGTVFEPLKRLTVEPSIRLGYNFIKYDYISDNYGKTAEFSNVNNIEAEFGVKVEKTFFHDNKNHSISKIYVKPSVIQNFGKGDVNITSLDSVEGIENQTLIRGELGGSFNFGNGWGGFGAIGYTFGSDYDATDFNLGINYNW